MNPLFVKVTFPLLSISPPLRAPVPESPRVSVPPTTKVPDKVKVAPDPFIVTLPQVGTAEEVIVEVFIKFRVELEASMDPVEYVKLLLNFKVPVKVTIPPEELI